MDILCIFDNTLGRFLYLALNIAMIAIPIFAIYKAIQHLKRQRGQNDTSDAELDFYRTTTELENNLRWDEEKRKMQKEQELLRKSNEILLHLIQDEHREEDR